MDQVTISRELLRQALDALTPTATGNWTPTIALNAEAAITALRSALDAPAAEPIGWSITCNGEHTGNFFASREAAEVRMIELNRKYPELRTIEPLFTAPQAQQPAPVHTDGWLQAESLLYRLTDESKPQNRDEINVTMADGSRSIESRTHRAGELLDRIRQQPRKAVKLTDDELEQMFGSLKTAQREMKFARAIEAAVLKKNGVTE